MVDIFVWFDSAFPGKCIGRILNPVVTAFFWIPYTRVYPKVSGLAAWSENFKWYSSLPLGVVVSPFCESV
jgi:hypothetical protein